MAKASGSESQKKSSPKKKGTQAQTRRSLDAPQRRRDPVDDDDIEGLIVDSNTRRDIIGVVFIIVAVVLMLLVALPQGDAAVSVLTSQWLHLCFGIGCYILPFVFLAIGITFLAKFSRERVPARASLGLSIIFVAFLGFVALFCPIASLGVDDPSLLFQDRALAGYGGYVGSAIAWVGIVLFGKVITGVILVGIMIIGLLVIGFSITRLVEKIRAKRVINSFRVPLDSSKTNHSFSPGRVRRREDKQKIDPYMLDMQLDGGDYTRPLVPGYAPNEINDNRRKLASQMQESQVIAQPSQVDYGYESIPQESIELESYEDEALTQPISITRRLVPIRHSKVDSASPAANLPVIAADGSVVAPIEEMGEEKSEPLPKIEAESKQKKAAKSNPREKGEGKRASDEGKLDKVKAIPIAAYPTPQGGFSLPPFDLLNASEPGSKDGASNSELSAVAERLQQTLADFGIDSQVKGWVAGPTVTLFQVELPSGIRVSRVMALNDDIALALAAPGVRIFAPIPGTSYVGIEVPNASRKTVLLSDVLKDAKDGPLQIAIGMDVEGNSIVSDLAKMPHLLIGGTTGSGKSVAINAMIMSILMRASPAEVRFIMIDPKRVEFTPYNGIPHLYVPVVTEPKEAASALAWGVAEMERRLKVFSKLGARNIGQYNMKVRQLKAEATGDAAGESQGADSQDELEEMPFIVIIIDELADLMMNIGKEVEISISRIAQLARAAGIHLIVATQRPSTNVVTGLIKANITNRIAFNVASGIDSRVILDSPGAESLIGLGDLLLSKPELAKPQRIQGCFVTEDEISKVVDFVKAQSEPEYHSEILTTNVIQIGSTDTMPDGGTDRDPRVWEAAEIVVSSGMGSTSNLQRRLSVGYARAGRIMDQLEEIGVVGPANGSKPREVLVDELELESLRAFEEQE